VFRGSLRGRLRASPLCDGAAFTRGLETAYREMWRRWCEEQREEQPALVVRATA
jgi:hypothetical protein